MEAELADAELVGEVAGDGVAPCLLGEGVVEGGVEGYSDGEVGGFLLEDVDDLEGVGVVEGSLRLATLDLLANGVVKGDGVSEGVSAVNDADGGLFEVVPLGVSGGEGFDGAFGSGGEVLVIALMLGDGLAFAGEDEFGGFADVVYGAAEELAGFAGARLVWVLPRRYRT